MIWTQYQSVELNDFPQDFGPVIAFISEARQAVKERNVGPRTVCDRSLLSLNQKTITFCVITAHNCARRGLVVWPRLPKPEERL